MNFKSIVNHPSLICQIVSIDYSLLNLFILIKRPTITPFISKSRFRSFEVECSRTVTSLCMRQ